MGEASEPRFCSAFGTARHAVDRGALERFKKSQGITPDQIEAVRAAEAHYNNLPLLLDPSLLELSRNALADATGPLVDENTPFVGMLWYGGATHTDNGVPFTDKFGGTYGQFVNLLKSRAQIVAPKRMGWVVEPTTNVDGRRTNESTKAVHALFLDCDGAGDWHGVIGRLAQLGYAYVAYQSGGWTAPRPKWRLVIPLSTPFDVSDEAKRASWKSTYNHCRVVFGALGSLLGRGFDPATETPCNPWFLTEKRDTADRKREVIFGSGHSLNLLALILALPAVEEEQRVHRVIERTDSKGLSDEQLEALIDALSKATANVPSGRHDLYLALPGVLLDRGVPADEVMAIIEEVSAAYPRIHPDKHKDNIHNAATTVAKWSAGGQVTRIGTLNARWPAVAHAIDAILPNPNLADFKQATEELLASSVSGKKRRRKLPPLGKEIAGLLASMKKSRDPKRAFSAVLIERILDGESLEIGNKTSAEIDGTVAFAMEAIGFCLPPSRGTTWAEVLDLAGPTLLSMDFTLSATRVAAAEAAFLRGQQQKIIYVAQQKKKADEERRKAQAELDQLDKKNEGC